jgi:lipopolysaccharide/colanic/teichoic acid biosynthesis glycosyltransferase
VHQTRTVLRRTSTSPRGDVWRAGRRDAVGRRLLTVVDAAALICGASVAVAVGNGLTPQHVPWLAAASPAWLAAVRASDTRGSLRPRASSRAVASAVIGALVLCALMPIAAPAVPATDALLLGVATAVAICALRPLAQAALAALLGPARVLLVGDGRLIGRLASRLRLAPGRVVEPVGRVAIDPQATCPLGLPTVAALPDLDVRGLVERLRVDHILLEDGPLPASEAGEQLRELRALPVPVSVLSPLADRLVPHAFREDAGGVTVLTEGPPRSALAMRAVKLVFDRAGAAALLFLALPLFAVISLAIKWDSSAPGPILFRQVRIGRDGRPFRLLKFRTMLADAESKCAALMGESRDANWLHLDHDPRVTWLGRFLRQWSLDELPQLVNVLRGDMSLVGPRPLAARDHEKVPAWAVRRQECRPGMTGVWQVLGRTWIPFDEMLELDCRYAAGWSLGWDLRLLAGTVSAVVSRRGVN